MPPKASQSGLLSSQPQAAGGSPRHLSTTATNDILELVGEADTHAPSSESGARSSLGNVDYIRSPRTHTNILVSHLSSPNGSRTNSFRPPFQNDDDADGAVSNGSSSSASDDLMAYTAGLGVATHRERRPSRSVFGVIMATGPMSPLSDDLNRIDPSPRSQAGGKDNDSAGSSKRPGVSALTAFVVGSILFIGVVLLANLLAAYATASIVSDATKSNAAVTVETMSAAALVQFRLKQSIALAGGRIAAAALASVGTAVTSTSGNASLSPNADAARVLVAPSEYAVNTLVGFCSVDQVSDPILCPPSMSITFTAFSDFTSSANTATAQAIYHTSTILARGPSRTNITVVSADVDLFNATQYPSAAVTVQRDATVSTTSLPVLAEKSLSQLLVPLPVAALRVLSAVRGVHDPLAFFATNGTLAQAVNNRAERFAFAKSVAVTSSIPTPWFMNAALLSGRRSVSLHRPDAQTMVQISLTPVVDGLNRSSVLATAVTTEVGTALASFTSKAYSRVCLVMYAPATDGSSLLGCRSGGPDVEREHSVIPDGATAIDERLRTIMLAARQHRRATGFNRYSDQYQPRDIRIATATHVVAVSLITSVTTVQPTTLALTPSELFLITIDVIPESVSASENASLQLGGVVIGIVVVATAVMLVLFFFNFVKPLRDIRHRMQLVAALDFSQIPEDVDPTESGEVGASFEADDATASPGSPCLVTQQAGGGVHSDPKLLRAKREAQEALRPRPVLTDVFRLYDDFFHVANALRTVVPFLPTSFQRRPSSAHSSNASPNGNRDSSPRELVLPSGKKSFLQFAPARIGDDAGDEDDATKGDDAKSTSSSADTEASEPAETRLSSISEIDLSEHALKQQSGASPSHASGAHSSPIHGNSGVHSDGSGKTTPLAFGKSSSFGPPAIRSGPPSATTAPLAATQPVVASSKRTAASSNGATTTTTPVATSAMLNVPAAASSSMNPFAATSTMLNLSVAANAPPAANAHLQYFDRMKHRYANDCHNGSVVVAYFELYLRKGARQSDHVAADVQKEFVMASIGITTGRKGQVCTLTAKAMAAVWTGASPELKACTAALDFCAHLKRWMHSRDELREAFRVSVGIAYGPATVGVLGTTTKKLFVCDGPTISRAAVLASTGLHNHAGVVVTAHVNEQVRMFATLRPIEQVAFPRALRKDRGAVSETVHQCLFLDQTDDDCEWMYRLEKKAEVGRTQSLQVEVSAAPAAVMAVPPWLSDVSMPDDNDKSELANYRRGYVAWCTGRLARALRELRRALEHARSTGIEDQFVTGKVELLEEMKRYVVDFEEYYSDDTIATPLHRRTTMAALHGNPFSPSNQQQPGGGHNNVDTPAGSTSDRSTDQMMMQSVHSSSGNMKQADRPMPASTAGAGSSVTTDLSGTFSRHNTTTFASMRVASWRPPGAAAAPSAVAAGVTNSPAAANESVHDSAALPTLHPAAPSRVKRAVEFFDPIRRGRPYARAAAQLGVETFQFESVS